MEWVETTGRTLEEAKDAALDQLGVDERDAEFKLLEEAKSGLFGRLRQEARVRARVRPDRPRPKVDRRDRRRRGDGERAATGSGSGESQPAPRRQSRPAARGEAGAGGSATAGEEAPDEGPSQEQQGIDAKVFLEGLVEAFGLEGTGEIEHLDETTTEVRVNGDGLGLLIGPKGQTLAAVQELTRAAVQRGPRRGSRLRVDVGGYQQRRREALERFTQGVAEQVRSSGVPTSLEAMPAPDRKVVHDTVNTIEGVRSSSEGEDPQRRVVLFPEDAAG